MKMKYQKQVLIFSHVLDGQVEIGKYIKGSGGGKPELAQGAGQLAPTKEDAIISDELNHGSIIDGVRLSHAKRYVYKHNDVADLEEPLRVAVAHREGDQAGYKRKPVQVHRLPEDRGGDRFGGEALTPQKLC